MLVDEINETSGRITPNESSSYKGYDQFSIKEEIPSSGYNRIVKAERYGKYFVLKGLKEPFCNDDAYQFMLRKEYEIMMIMDHHNIVRVYSLEEVDGMGLCIVMEWIDGRPLDRWLAEKRPSAAMRRRVVRQLLDAMTHWHTQQVVHRDLKPSNILVTNNGNNVKVIDFGLADGDRYAVLKEPAYTLSYASPEQLHGEPLDCRSDIYSFGRVLSLIFPHRMRSISRHCTRNYRDQRYPSAEAVLNVMQGRKKLTIAIIVLFLLLAGLYWKIAFHYTSQSFDYEVAPGQVLQMDIVDSKVHIIGFDTLSGDLVLPERVRRGIFFYPIYQINKRAFYECRDLQHITFPSTLRRIEDQAFKLCSNLSDTLVLPEKLVYLGDGVFEQCVNISVCRVNSRRLHLKDEPSNGGRFGKTNKMHTIIIDGNVDTICEQLFYWAYWGVHEIYLEEGLTQLGAGSFAELYNLEQVHFPSTLKRINEDCFYGCGFKRMILPDGIEEIGDQAFACMIACKYFEVGPNVRHISHSVFYDCRVLDTLRFRGTTPPLVESNTFGHRSDSTYPTILVPAQSLELYQKDTNFAKLNPIGY